MSIITNEKKYNIFYFLRSIDFSFCLRNLHLLVRFIVKFPVLDPNRQRVSGAEGPPYVPKKK